MGSVSGETELSGSFRSRTAVKFINLPKLTPDFDFFIIRIFICEWFICPLFLSVGDFDIAVTFFFVYKSFFCSQNPPKNKIRGEPLL